jgi:hypothetical protein
LLKLSLALKFEPHDTRHTQAKVGALQLAARLARGGRDLPATMVILLSGIAGLRATKGCTASLLAYASHAL